MFQKSERFGVDPANGGSHRRYFGAEIVQSDSLRQGLPDSKSARSAFDAAGILRRRRTPFLINNGASVWAI